MRLSTLIKGILRDNEVARDSDTELILQVWKAQGLELTPAQIMKFRQLRSPESVRRTRQKIQESGEYRGKNYKQKQVKGKIVQHEIKHNPEPAQLFDDADEKINRVWR